MAPVGLLPLVVLPPLAELVLLVGLPSAVDWHSRHHHCVDEVEQFRQGDNASAEANSVGAMGLVPKPTRSIFLLDRQNQFAHTHIQGHRVFVHSNKDVAVQRVTHEPPRFFVLD